MCINSFTLTQFVSALTVVSFILHTVEITHLKCAYHYTLAMPSLLEQSPELKLLLSLLLSRLYSNLFQSPRPFCKLSVIMPIKKGTTPSCPLNHLPCSSPSGRCWRGETLISIFGFGNPLLAWDSLNICCPLMPETNSQVCDVDVSSSMEKFPITRVYSG